MGHSCLIRNLELRIQNSMNIKKILQNTLLPPLDAELLLSRTLKKPRKYLFTHPEKKLTKNQIVKFNNFSKRRAKGEPIAYLLGKKEFYGLEFLVNKNVLIPRPETEMLVDRCLDIILDTKYSIPDTKIIDIGTGSGNIIISIVKNIPAKIRKKINFYATDISEKTLRVAKKNARKHKIDKYIKFIKSSLLEFASKKKSEGNVIIVANLPYVSRSLYQKHKDNLKYEPKTALISEKNGLERYVRLIREIGKIRKSGISGRVLAFFEISPEQKKGISEIIRQALPPAKIRFFKDLSGKTRVVKIDK